MSFESNIKGTRHLAGLALSSPHAASVRFVFISSVGTLLGWKDASVVVPEEPINDPRIAIGNGYGESKFVTEKVCSCPQCLAILIAYRITLYDRSWRRSVRGLGSRRRAFVLAK